MIGLLGLAESALLSATLVGIPVYLLVVILAPRAIPVGGSHGSREALVRAWLYAPLWVPLAIVVGMMLPGPVGAALGVEDHCQLYVDWHHHHLCLVHPPHFANHPVAWGTLLCLGALGVARVGHSALRSFREWQLARTLVRTCGPSNLGHDVRVLDAEQPLALAVGVLSPVVVVSTGMLKAVSGATLDLVLAHERAHVTRRDNARAILDRSMASCLPTSVRTLLLRELSLAREQACDAAAARAGRTTDVAAAIVSVARLGLREPVAGMSMGAASIEARVRYLLNGDRTGGSGRLVAAGALAAVVLVGAGPLHAVIEHAVDHLLH